MRIILKEMLKMGKSPKYNKGSFDSILTNILREKPLDWELFRKKSLEAGIPSSTFYTRVKQLEKYGILERSDIVRLTVKYTEANPKEISDILKVIHEQSNLEINKNRLNQLRIISEKHRVSHLPGVIQALEKFISEPWIINDDVTREDLMGILFNALHFEREHPGPDSELYIRELTGPIFKEVISLLEKRETELCRNTALYLRESGKSEAVDLLFSEIKTHYAENLLEKLDLQFLLGKSSPLYKVHYIKIQACIDELLESGLEEMIVFAKKLRQTIELSRT